MSMNWSEFKEAHPPGHHLKGTVLRRRPYGFFVDVGAAFEGFVDILNYIADDEIAAPASFPPEGATISVKVLGYRDSDRQVQLSMRKYEPELSEES